MRNIPRWRALWAPVSTALAIARSRRGANPTGSPSGRPPALEGTAHVRHFDDQRSERGVATAIGRR